MAKDKAKSKAKEADAPEGEDGAKPKKKLPMKLMLMAGAGALVVLGGGGTAAFMFLGKGGDEAHAEKGGHGEKKKKKEKKGGHGKGGKEEEGGPVVTEGPDGVVFYTLPDMVVNVQSPDGRPTFLKLKLTLELPGEHAVESLEPNGPRLQDMFQTFLRELRPEDLQGSHGSYQLRAEIQRRVNLVIAPEKVNAVLIEEMLIQ